MPGTWKPLNTQPGFNASTMLLLTDGSVMVHQDASNQWHRWTPDPFDPTRDYANGSWKALATMPNLPQGTPGGTTNAPLYYASAVLKDGRVFVAGGEHNGNASVRAGAGLNAQLLAAQIYDPINDSWTAITTFPPGWTQIGDAPCCVLPDGRVLLGNGSTTAGAASTPAIYDPVTGTWTSTTAKNDVSAEETWTLLPNGSVLTVECTSTPNVESFNALGWVADAPTIINGVPFTMPVAPSPNLGNEIGPAILLPGGSVFAIGGGAGTLLYAPPPPPLLTGPPVTTGSWSLGPLLQSPGPAGTSLFGADTPACLLPNGSVLCCATSVIIGQGSNNSVFFFEYDPATNTLSTASTPPNAGNQLFNSRMLLVPSGQVLFANRRNDIEVYTPAPGIVASARPQVETAPSRVVPGFSYTLTGTGFNGVSQAVSFGDDASSATNYPIVSLSHLESGHVRYGRTFGHSTMGVATGEALVETTVEIPWGMEAGDSEIILIANGIGSNAGTVLVAQVRSLRRWMVANGKTITAPLLPQLPATGVSLNTLLPLNAA
jgi:hypothetical protein